MLLSRQIVIIFILSITAILNILNQKLYGQSRHNTALKIERTKNFLFNKSGVADNWQKAKWINLSQIKGLKRDDYYTKVKILYSNTGIYFLFDCGDKILDASFHEDYKKLWKQDVVEVFLWPDDATPVYFEYELSPLNYELPILVSDKQSEEVRWIPFMYKGSGRQIRHKTIIIGGKKESEAHIKKWFAKIFIPFKLLNPLNNISPRPGTKWRVNLYRIDYDRGDTSWWAWQSIKKSFHEYKNFGTFIFE
jgi:hypothetical protein